MKKEYEIPSEGAGHLGVGMWIEIFEAYGEAEGGAAIRVRRMRVGGETFVFGGERPEKGGRALHPHEGEVVYVDRGADRTRFGIRLDS